MSDRVNDRVDPAPPERHEVEMPTTSTLRGLEGLGKAKAKAKEKLRDRKTRMSGLWGAVVTGAAFVASALDPSLFAGYGPVAVGAAAGVQFLATLITRNTDSTQSTIQTYAKTMANTDAPSWAEIVDYLEEKGIMTAQQIVDDFEALASDEDLQIMIVSRLNTDLDVPFVPESVEGMGMHAGYDVLQEVFQSLADEAGSRLG